MLVVIDTNVLIAIVPSKSRYHSVYQAIQQKKILMAITSEILLEYEEQLKLRYKNYSVDEELEGLVNSRNVFLYSPDFNWNLIAADPEDNKFVDCAVAANADFIVTNDAHFNILKTISFPKVNTISLQEFISLLQTP
ncbi:putative toxin-antitoxin system toxin component, PIN family [Foetidibacter luteolus]|uniref:putative toxin-antitoxin system toxin component, PIN family n=1 Tax=Foetidibacter luteolus TaxID=2608880 RepID=UPI00129AD9F9|nr:putative toxin-antitoxin system toxin component, PIN family [Foetidibacter luteolus]